MKHISRFILPGLLVLLIVPLLYAAGQGEAKRVLVLFSEDKAHPGHAITEQGIREAFRSNKLFDVQLFTEYLDVSRFGSISHARTMADYLRRKYSGMEIHAIIAVYPYAVNFLLDERRELFPDVPIIASEMLSKGYVENLEHSPARRFLTGTIMQYNLAGLMDTALRMKPKTRYIALIAGTAPNDTFSETFLRSGLRPYAGRINLIDLTKLSMAETLSRVGSLPPDTLVLYSSIFRDGAGKIFVPREALSLVARAAKVPVFGFYDSYLGHGIVGGRLASLEKHGREAAAMALRIMGGEKPASIPFGGEQGYISAYDWRELKRWNIPEIAVPAGAEIRFRIPSFWEEYRGAIIGTASLILFETILILGLLINIGRRRQAELSLRASEERYRMLFESAPEGIVLIGADGHVRNANSLQASLYGYESPRQLDGISALLFVSDTDRERAALNMRDLLQGKELPDRIYTAVRRDGTEFVVEVTSVIIRGSRQEVQGYLCLTRDITKSKVDEGERAHLLHELAHLSRIMTMNELSTSLAHEINQPLGAILRNAEAAELFLQASSPDLEEVRAILADIRKDDQRAGAVIDRMRSLLKQREVEHTLLDLNLLAGEIITLVIPEANSRKVRLALEPVSSLPPVWGDRVQLQQVLLNLLLNAMDAMNDSAPDGRRITVRVQARGSQVKIVVSDTGHGIPADKLSQVFKAFFSTKPNGLGMGLAISHSIIEAHGGSIRAKNNEAGGATFTITLTAAEGDDAK